jgi:hypothetical protein
VINNLHIFSQYLSDDEYLFSVAVLDAREIATIIIIIIIIIVIILY